jgi:hypothetical protein
MVEFRVIVVDVGIVSMPTDLVTAARVVRVLLGRGRKAGLEVARREVPAYTVMIVRAELMLDPEFDCGPDEQIPLTPVHGEIEQAAFDNLSTFILDAAAIAPCLCNPAVDLIRAMQSFLLEVHRDRLARINAKTVAGSYTLN